MTNPFKKFSEEKQAEREDWARRNPEHKLTKFQIIVRILAGGYLLWSIYKMIREGALNTTGGAFYFNIAMMVLFLVSGVLFMYKGIKCYIKHDYFDPSKDDFSKPEEEGENVPEPEPEPEPDPDAPKSLSQLAKLPESSQVPEDEQ